MGGGVLSAVGSRHEFAFTAYRTPPVGAKAIPKQLKETSLLMWQLVTAGATLLRVTTLFNASIDSTKPNGMGSRVT